MREAEPYAVKDSLTGLSTRAILDSLFLDLKKSRKFSLILFDIDNFKLVNDCNGHQRGDQVLMDMAGFLNDQVKEGHIIRMGGDEFVIVLPGYDRISTVRFSKKLLHAVNSTVFKGNPDLSITLSGGIALFPVDGKDVEELVGKADSRLYTAKRNGRNQFCMIDERQKKDVLHEPTRLIGRERAFLLLREELERVACGKSGTVIVTGEEGVGKTFLCNTFLDYAKIRGGEVKKKTMAAGECTIHRSLVSLIQPISSSHTFLVVFIDDFVNVEDRDSPLFENPFKQSVKVPVLFLLAMRDSSWQQRGYGKRNKSRKHFRVISLDAFNKKHYKNYVKTILRGEKINRELLQLLFRKSGGNPLFTKQLLNAAMVNSLIETYNGEWRIVKRDAPLVISDSLKSILFERLENLTDREKDVLTIASVGGIDFDCKHISKVMHIDSESLIRLLRKPIQQGMVDDKGEGRFSFRLVYQEVLYASIPRTETKMIHRKIGSILEKEGYVKESFFHYVRAGEKKKARRFARTGCETALRQAHYNDAMMYAHFLLSNVAENDPFYALILLLAARSYAVNGSYEKAIELYRSCIKKSPTRRNASLLAIAELYHKQGKYKSALDELLTIKARDPVRMCAVLNAIAQTLVELGKMDEGEVYVKKAIALSKRYHLKEEEAEGYYVIAGIFWYRGEYELSDDFLKRALKMYQQQHNDVKEASVKNRLGIIKWSQGNLQDALSMISEAVEIFRTHSKIEEESRAYTNLGILKEALGEWEQAKAQYQKSIDIATFLKLTPLLCRNFVNLGTLLLKMGDYQDGISYFKRSINLRSKHKDSIEIGTSFHNLGVAYMFSGDFKKARYFLVKAKTIFETKRAVGFVIDNLTTLFELHVSSKEQAKAQHLVARIDKLLDSNGTEFQRAQFYRLMSRFKREKKELDESRRFARLSIELLRDDEEQYELGKSLFEFGITLSEEGDRQSAKRAFMQSRTIFRKLGAKKALERVGKIMIKRRWRSREGGRVKK